MYMKKIPILLTAAALAVALGGCRSGDAGDKRAELEKLRQQKQELEQRIRALEQELGNTPSAARRQVTISEVQPKTFTSYIEVQGELDADQNVLVTPIMPAVVRSVYVSSGQQVSKGQPLAEMDNEALKKNLAALQHQLDLARSLYQRQQALWQQQVGTEVQYLTAKTNMETLEQQVAALQEQLEQTILIAPFAGSVDEVNLKLGELAAPGINGVRVVNNRDLKVTAAISEANSARVRVNMPVQILFPDLQKELTASLTYVGKVIDPQSRSFKVECRIPGGEGLKPNMVAVLRIVDYEKTNAMVLDVNLLQQGREGHYVMVAREQQGQWTAQRLPVTVGRIFNGQAEILSGLQPGERIITAGYQDLVAGQPILPAL